MGFNGQTPGQSMIQGLQKLGDFSQTVSGLPAWLQSKVGNPLQGTTPMYPASSGMTSADIARLAQIQADKNLKKKDK